MTVEYDEGCSANMRIPTTSAALTVRLQRLNALHVRQEYRVGNSLTSDDEFRIGTCWSPRETYPWSSDIRLVTSSFADESMLLALDSKPGNWYGEYHFASASPPPSLEERSPIETPFIAIASVGATNAGPLVCMDVNS